MQRRSVKLTIHVIPRLYKKIKKDAKKRQTSQNDAIHDALCNFYGVKSA